ncbi:MAG: hypothetical protein NUV75_01040 [Gallionella sp.]|nr:hypothetical protein [Gallionella sp.]
MKDYPASLGMGSQRREFWRVLLRWSRAAFLILAIGFLSYFAWRTRDILHVAVAQGNITYLLMAAMIWAVLHLLSPVVAILVFSGERPAVNYKRALHYHVRNLPARYLPGGIWHTVGRVLDFHAHGISKKRLTAFVFLENSLAASVTIFVGGAWLGYSGGSGGWGDIGAFAAAMAFVGMIVILPVTNRWILGGAGRITLLRYMCSIGVVAVFWSLAALAFILYVYAFANFLPGASLVDIAGVYLFSWGIGFISIFAPQGIGVFEVVSSSILTAGTGLELVIVLLSGFRLVVLSADLIAWVLNHLVRLAARYCRV